MTSFSIHNQQRLGHIEESLLKSVVQQFLQPFSRFCPVLSQLSGYNILSDNLRVLIFQRFNQCHGFLFFYFFYFQFIIMNELPNIQAKSPILLLLITNLQISSILKIYVMKQVINSN